MNILVTSFGLLLLGPMDLPTQSREVTPSISAKKRYVCPPCPVECHEKAYDAPGRCERCGMTLVEQGVRNVAILVWSGVELLDFAGPAEVFTSARVGGSDVFRVYTVAPDSNPITSQGFLKVTPNYAIEDCPPPSILIIPGGDMRPVVKNKKVMAWIKKTSNNTDMILSVCTGAFPLAQAGLLNNIEATTWHGAIEDLRREAPHTKVHDDRRFVDNGDIITSAGVSAGIDGAMHALARLTGPDVARKTARYMEYDWRPSIPKTDLATEIKRRITTDPDGVLFDLQTCLKEGTREASEVLVDPDLFGLHENARFRALIGNNIQRETISLATKDEPGEPLFVTGRVLDEAGKPLTGARVYVYHTGKDGVYSSKGGNTGNMGDSLNPRLFGFMRTGEDGRYEYRTIRPGQYPRSGPPAHVHYEVEAYKHPKLVTELMFEDDSRMNSRSRAEFEKAGFIIARPVKGDDGIWKCECDVTVGKT
jgi:protocatechuate 3,4-dioxygenase beta subunit/putative intracellular protease/amidase